MDRINANKAETLWHWFVVLQVAVVHWTFMCTDSDHTSVADKQSHADSKSATLTASPVASPAAHWHALSNKH